MHKLAIMFARSLARRVIPTGLVFSRGAVRTFIRATAPTTWRVGGIHYTMPRRALSSLSDALAAEVEFEEAEKKKIPSLTN